MRYDHLSIHYCVIPQAVADALGADARTPAGRRKLGRMGRQPVAPPKSMAAAVSKPAPPVVKPSGGARKKRSDAKPPPPLTRAALLAERVDPATAALHDRSGGSMSAHDCAIGIGEFGTDAEKKAETLAFAHLDDGCKFVTPPWPPPPPPPPGAGRRLRRLSRGRQSHAGAIRDTVDEHTWIISGRDLDATMTPEMTLEWLYQYHRARPRTGFRFAFAPPGAA